MTRSRGAEAFALHPIGPFAPFPVRFYILTPARSRTGQSPLRAGASSPQCLGGPDEHF
jgi:hypothetical protein